MTRWFSLPFVLFMAHTAPVIPFAAPIVVTRSAFDGLSLSDQRDSLVTWEARRQGIPVWLAKGISHAENWGGDSTVVNPFSGCVGLLQVCPYDMKGDSLWIGAFPECGLETVPPLVGRRRNICVGLKVLRMCMDKHRVLASVLACFGGATRDGTRRRYVDDVARRTLVEWL